MSARAIRVALALPLTALLLAGTTFVAVRGEWASAPPSDRSSGRAAPAAAPAAPAPPAAAPVPDGTPAAAAEPAAAPASPPAGRVDYRKLSADLERASAALERFNRKLMLVLAPPAPPGEPAPDPEEEP